MSTAVTILIALASGLLGILARNAFERASDLRTRQLEAADALLAAAIPMLDDLGRSAPEVLGSLEPLHATIWGAKPVDDALRDMDSAAKALVLILARIDLLFGADSDAGSTAHALVNGLRNALGMLVFTNLSSARAPREQDFISGIHASYNQAHATTMAAYERFGPTARRVVVPWWRWWERPALPALGPGVLEAKAGAPET